MAAIGELESARKIQALRGAPHHTIDARINRFYQKNPQLTVANQQTPQVVEKKQDTINDNVYKTYPEQQQIKPVQEISQKATKDMTPEEQLDYFRDLSQVMDLKNKEKPQEINLDDLKKNISTNSGKNGSLVNSPIETDGSKIIEASKASAMSGNISKLQPEDFSEVASHRFVSQVTNRSIAAGAHAQNLEELDKAIPDLSKKIKELAPNATVQGTGTMIPQKDMMAVYEYAAKNIDKKHFNDLSNKGKPEAGSFRKLTEQDKQTLMLKTGRKLAVDTNGEMDKNLKDIQRIHKERKDSYNQGFMKEADKKLAHTH